MKNLSELMIEMAYSALFLRDARIAAQVDSLYKRIEHLETETMSALFKVREPEEERILLIDLVDFVKDIANAARSIASLSKSKAVSPIVADILKESDLRVVTESVSKNSVLANKTIGEAKIRAYALGARIVCIKRDENWIFNITGDTKLVPGDFVVAIGTKHSDELLKSVLAGKRKSWS